MDNADLAEMLCPGTQQITVRYGEGQMVQNLVGGFARLIARTLTLCKHHDDVCVSMFQREVADIGIFNIGAKSKYGAIPASTCPYIRHHELHVR